VRGIDHKGHSGKTAILSLFLILVQEKKGEALLVGVIRNEGVRMRGKKTSSATFGKNETSKRKERNLYLKKETSPAT